MSSAREQGASGVSNPVGLSGIFVAAFLTAPAIFLALRFFAVVKEFEELFKRFGTDVPGLTRLILAHPLRVAVGIWLCTAVQVTALILLIVNRTGAARRVFWGIAVVTLGAVITFIVALYLPIFRLGAPV